MTDSPPPPLPKPPRNLLPLGLGLAFSPSVFALLLVTLGYSGVDVAPYCLPAAILALACCTASSIILFKRNTGLAIVFGVLLALLNLCVSLGLGCAALFNGTNFH